MNFMRGILVILCIGAIFLSIAVLADQISAGCIRRKIFGNDFRINTVNSRMVEKKAEHNNRVPERRLKQFAVLLYLDK